jgi:hypothetical protein
MTSGGQSGAGAPAGGDCGGRMGEGLGMITGGVSGAETSAEGLGCPVGAARSHPLREAATTSSNVTAAGSALSEPPTAAWSRDRLAAAWAGRSRGAWSPPP